MVVVRTPEGYREAAGTLPSALPGTVWFTGAGGQPTFDDDFRYDPIGKVLRVPFIVDVSSLTSGTSAAQNFKVLDGTGGAIIIESAAAIVDYNVVLPAAAPTGFDGQMVSIDVDGKLTWDTGVFQAGGRLGVGGVPVASAKLEVRSTTQGLLPPRMTTVQRDAIAAPAGGLMIFNLTTSTMDFFNGAVWASL